MADAAALADAAELSDAVPLADAAPLADAVPLAEAAALVDAAELVEAATLTEGAALRWGPVEILPGTGETQQNFASTACLVQPACLRLGCTDDLVAAWQHCEVQRHCLPDVQRLVGAPMPLTGVGCPLWRGSFAEALLLQ